jgi:hypothetical protein
MGDFLSMRSLILPAFPLNVDFELVIPIFGFCCNFSISLPGQKDPAAFSLIMALLAAAFMGFLD